MREVMRSKKCVVFSMFLIISGFTIYVFHQRNPDIQTLVSKTQEQFVNLKENFKTLDQKDTTPHEDLLRKLGFISKPSLYEDVANRSLTLPVVLTTVSSGQFELLALFLVSVRQTLPGHAVIVYDMGLSGSEHGLASSFCNSTSCSIRIFDYDLYPSHIGDLGIGSYRPIIIQESLNTSYAVLYVEINYHLSNGSFDDAFDKARTSGVCAWSVETPASVLTHPSMYEHFSMQQDMFYFQRMVELNYLIIYNKKRIHEDLILPWLKCALTFDCVAPIGAQRKGCRFDKKPLYRYSGCHRYDESAFNIILGRLFAFDAGRYTAPRQSSEYFNNSEGESGEADKAMELLKADAKDRTNAGAEQLINGNH